MRDLASRRMRLTKFAISLAKNTDRFELLQRLRRTIPHRLGNEEVWLTERQGQHGDVVFLTKSLSGLGDGLR